MTLDQLKKKKLPDLPGVYFFLGKRKEVIYIGKATSLKDRVRSYFSPDLIEGRGIRIVNMVEEAKSVDVRTTDSVLEALILEANLVKAHKPRFNTLLQDDKTFNFVVITKEDFPRVLLVRGKDLPVDWPASKRQSVFGPFPHGLQLKEALRLIRRIFPYRDSKCVPAPDQLREGQDPRPCFNRQIGLCPGVCTGEVDKAAYRKIVRHICLFLDGKKKALLRELEKEMKVLAKEERFEEAAEHRRQMFALTHIQDVSLIKEEFKNPDGVGIFRIEAYDVAHLMGGAMVGVMTVVEQGATMPSQYRKFNIKTVTKSNDPAALSEILSRRLGHAEWPMPKLIVVDGSTAQINAAEKVLSDAGARVPIIGVVKDEKHRPKQIKGDRMLITLREKDILLANAEAHRYAIAFHRKKKRKELL